MMQQLVAHRVVATVVVGATLAMSLGGCGRKSDQTAAARQAPAVTQVTDDTGVSISVVAGAPRILSVTPGATEMLFAAGAGSHVVATVTSADTPEAARRIPRVGDATSLDYEKVMQSRADVVVVWQDINTATMVEKLRSLKIPVYTLRATTLRDIPRSIERLGALAGTPEVAKAAATELDQKLDALAQRRRAAQPLQVFYQIWEGPLYTIGGKHIITDALQICGANNIFSDLKWPANVVGREAVVKRDPEVIILSAPVLTAREWAGYWSYYPAMRAVANKKVHAWTDERLDRMGPGAIDAVLSLCSVIDELRGPAR